MVFELAPTKGSPHQGEWRTKPLKWLPVDVGAADPQPEGWGE